MTSLIQRATFEECRTLCGETAGCNFYTWDKETKNCWLRSNRTKTRSNDEKWVSGKPCKKCNTFSKNTLEYLSFVQGKSQECRKPNVEGPASCRIKDFDCYDFEYQGDLNVTEDGSACKTWTINGWTHNKCRNDGYYKPWCNKVNGGYDTCPIRKCEKCDKSGEKYFEDLKFLDYQL